MGQGGSGHRSKQPRRGRPGNATPSQDGPPTDAWESRNNSPERVGAFGRNSEEEIVYIDRLNISEGKQSKPPFGGSDHTHWQGSEDAMSLVRWEPFGEMRRMREQMNRLFDDFFTTRPSLLPILPWSGDAFSPSVDVYETEKEVVVKAELPGVRKEDLEIVTLEDALTIKGEVKSESEVNEEGYSRRERRYGGFTRTIPLPMSVKAEEAKAKFEDGVLEIRLPKREEAKVTGTKIQIQ